MRLLHPGWEFSSYINLQGHHKPTSCSCNSPLPAPLLTGLGALIAICILFAEYSVKIYSSWCGCCTSCTREEVALVAGRGCLFVFHVPAHCLWLLLLFKVWLLMHCLCLKSWLYNVFIAGGVVIHTFNY